MKWQYGFLGNFHIVISIIYTKVFFPKARLIRIPFDVRNKRGMIISKGFTSGKNCRFECLSFNKKTLFIGKNVQVNDNVHITAFNNVHIGNNVLIASKVYISDCTHGSYSDIGDHSTPESRPSERELVFKPVKIEDNVWIGENVSVLPGVLIGKGSIIGANSVVTKNIPPEVIAAGVPAKILKKYNRNSQKWEIIKK
jgi:acetyltransferase-like isoleucine patch superfamily enzyme